MDNGPNNKGLPFTIWMLSIPIFIDMLLSFSMFFIDSFFLSQISTTAAAAVGTVIPIFVIFVLLFMMIAQGGANVAGHYLGAKQFEGAKQTYTGTFLINSLLGLVVCVALLAFAPTLVTLFGMTNEAEFFAGEYLRYISIALFLLALKSAMSAVCMSQGKTQYNLYSGIIVNVLNIGLNSLFLFGLDMGLYGIILATIISQAVTCLYYLYVVIKRMNHQYEFGKVLQKFGEVTRPILAIGVPAAIQPISAEAGMFVLSLFAVAIGEDAMAARVFVMNLLTVCICWSSAMSVGNQIMVSHLYGAKQYRLIGEKVDEHVKFSMAGSLVAAAILFIAGDVLLGVFTSDQAIISTGLMLLSFGLVIEPLRSHAMMVSYSLKATGDARFPAMVGVIVTWLVAIPLGYFLSIKLGIGVAGLWVALLIDEIFRAGINNGRWLSGKWQETEAMHLQPQEA